MFGCIVAGRSLQTELNQIDETHAAFELPAAEQINHICVFLLGTGKSYSLTPFSYELSQLWILTFVSPQFLFLMDTARRCTSFGPGRVSNFSECEHLPYHIQCSLLQLKRCSMSISAGFRMRNHLPSSGSEERSQVKSPMHMLYSAGPVHPWQQTVHP